MFNLKEKYINKWSMFESGNFSMNKSDISFSRIGGDHTLKQENRAVKILGGKKGIGNNMLWAIHCKVFKYGVFPGPYFFAFGLKTDQKKLRIWTLSMERLFSDSSRDEEYCGQFLYEFTSRLQGSKKREKRCQLTSTKHSCSTENLYQLWNMQCVKYSIFSRKKFFLQILLRMSCL